MIIGLVSDSHGKPARLQAAVSRLRDAELIIHLGDGASDWEAMERGCHCPILQIQGNCDWHSHYPETIVREMGGICALFTHGHKFGVKLGMERLYYAALERQVQLACYGHTHLPAVDMKNGICFVNPGSIASSGTCARITIHEDGRVIPAILSILEP